MAEEERYMMTRRYFGAAALTTVLLIGLSGCLPAPEKSGGVDPERVRWLLIREYFGVDTGPLTSVIFDKKERALLVDDIVNQVQTLEIVRYDKTEFKFYMAAGAEIPSEDQLQRAYEFLQRHHNTSLDQFLKHGLKPPEAAYFYIIRREIPDQQNFEWAYWSFTSLALRDRSGETHSIINLEGAKAPEIPEFTPFWTEFAQTFDRAPDKNTWTGMMIKGQYMLTAETRNNEFGLAAGAAQAGMTYAEYSNIALVEGETPSGRIYLDLYSPAKYRELQGIFKDAR